MKKLAFTTAIALALATTAYAQGQHHGGGGGGGPGPSMAGGGGPGFSATAPGAGGGMSGPSVKGGPSGPSGFSNSTGPNRGQTGGLYNQGRPNMNTYKQGGSDFDKGRNRMGDRDFDRGDHDQNRHLYNRADRDHDFDRRDHGGNIGGDRDFRHHGVVRGNFFEHGRHFGFRRFWNGQWVFLNAWDDCTAYAWVHVAPGTWAWAPVNICVG